ncbi:hypothetical protein IKG33_01770 [Candidatus Saccharibacteria bacterium]|nr:hypothetical protein [Candidatus Saccharibacteria bacterium]
MLGKLLKYDLKANFKFLAIFYILALIFAAITRILFAVGDSLFLIILAYVFNGATIAMIANILINNLMRLWVYFKSNLYGDEGYLMHTLPVPRRNLYLSKFLMGLITLITSTVIVIVVMAIAWLTPESFEGLKNLLSPMASMLDSTAVKLVLAMVVIVLLEIMAMLFSGYTGIILGFKKLANRVRWSVLFGLICYVMTQVIIVVGILILAGVNPEIGEPLLSSELAIPDISVLKPVFILSILLYVIMIGVNYLISERLFRKINLD